MKIGVCRHCYDALMCSGPGQSVALCDRDFRRLSVAPFKNEDLFVDSEYEQDDSHPAEQPRRRHSEDDQPTVSVPFTLPDFGESGFGGFGGGESGGGGADRGW